MNWLCLCERGKSLDAMLSKQWGQCISLSSENWYFKHMHLDHVQYCSFGSAHVRPSLKWNQSIVLDCASRRPVAQNCNADVTELNEASVTAFLWSLSALHPSSHSGLKWCTPTHTHSCFHPQQDTEQVEQCWFLGLWRDWVSLYSFCLCVQLLKLKKKKKAVPITHIEPNDDF